MLRHVKYTKDFIVEINSHASDLAESKFQKVDFSDYFAEISTIEDEAVEYANNLDFPKYQLIIYK